MVQRRAWPWIVKRKGSRRSFSVADKSNRTDSTFSRADFAFDPERGRYMCPAGKELVQFRRTYATPRSGVTAEGTGSIAPVNWIARSASSKRNAARTRSPARSTQGSAPKSRSRRRSRSRLDARIRGCLSSASKENRICSPLKQILRLAALAPKGSEWGKRRVPSRCNRTRSGNLARAEPTNDSGNAGRVTPFRPQDHHPKFHKPQLPQPKAHEVAHFFNDICAKRPPADWVLILERWRRDCSRVPIDRSRTPRLDLDDHGQELEGFGPVFGLDRPHGLAVQAEAHRAVRGQGREIGLAVDVVVQSGAKIVALHAGVFGGGADRSLAQAYVCRRPRQIAE